MNGRQSHDKSNADLREDLKLNIERKDSVREQIMHKVVSYNGQKDAIISVSFEQPDVDNSQSY